MRRNLALIGVAAFVLIDATLIGFAMNHAGAAPGSSTVVVTQTVGASPPSARASDTAGNQTESPPIASSPFQHDTCCGNSVEYRCVNAHWGVNHRGQDSGDGHHPGGRTCQSSPHSRGPRAAGHEQ